ncbi:MAG: DUF294 nucleotidyltransferase-like domain-containing protein [Halomonas sp.]|nr:putative nucleotidyltransferase substrate binding domain-containing protein [Halomonas sp.]MDN6296961.1 DUF294 nucleotidyltransferase-like domain-containing protein [Halomonas sp.]MDN6314491.1 DUF294 nucleotidyltransferase-like domain-containing protein [Halomonas sp.]
MVDVDLSQPPFTLLDAAGREHARCGMDIAYFERDEIILDTGQAGESLFLIHQGEVAEVDPTLPRATARIGLYTAGDLFGAISMLNGQSRYRFIAEQDCLCYLFPRVLFQQLCRAYPEFDHFFRQSLADKASRLMEQRAPGEALSAAAWSIGHADNLQIEQAGSLSELAAASRRTPELVSSLMAQGVKLRCAMELLAALNGRIIHKAWQLCVAPRYHNDSCLIVMGSEGRGEQILKTDQDNGLILDDTLDWPDVDGAMHRLTDTLVTLGYPPCPGNIMVSNPEWRGSVSEWQARIARWAAARDGDSLMKIAIMLDAHAVAGSPTLLERVRGTLFDHCADDDLLLSYFARAALRFSTPLTLFGSLKKPQHGIDIKKGGIFPIVHGVRTMALERRIMATSTFERLEALVTDGRLPRRFADDVGEALSLFTELRLKRQLEAPTADGQSRDRVVVQTLSSLERDLLREALHIVKDLKQRLSHRYHLEYS